MKGKKTPCLWSLFRNIPMLWTKPSSRIPDYLLFLAPDSLPINPGSDFLPNRIRISSIEIVLQVRCPPHLILPTKSKGILLCLKSLQGRRLNMFLNNLNTIQEVKFNLKRYDPRDRLSPKFHQDPSNFPLRLHLRNKCPPACPQPRKGNRWDTSKCKEKKSQNRKNKKESYLFRKNSTWSFWKEITTNQSKRNKISQISVARATKVLLFQLYSHNQKWSQPKKLKLCLSLQEILDKRQNLKLIRILENR